MRKQDKAGEFWAVWSLLADHHQPDPVAEHRFHQSRKWRFDWAWPEQKVAVEVDGGVWKPFGGRHGSDSDREKHNAAVQAGWRVLRYSPAMIDSNPDAVVAQVLAVLKGS